MFVFVIFLCLYLLLLFYLVLSLYFPYFVACICPKTLFVGVSSSFDANFDILLLCDFFSCTFCLCSTSRVCYDFSTVAIHAIKRVFWVIWVTNGVFWITNSVLKQKQSVLTLLIDVFHLFHVLHVLKTFAMFSNPGLQDFTICRALPLSFCIVTVCMSKCMV